VILVDTSVWVAHLARGNAALAELLSRNMVCTHPGVIGELALGNLRSRAATLADLQRLPQLEAATEAELLVFVEGCALAGSGIGYVDAHLLAATRMQPGARLWTEDRRLREVARRLGLAI
jgi:predicted nucleic acid-binding protein